MGCCPWADRNHYVVGGRAHGGKQTALINLHFSKDPADPIYTMFSKRLAISYRNIQKNISLVIQIGG